MLKVVRWDLLRDPPGENRGTRGVKIGIMNKTKSGPALERGRTKPNGAAQRLIGIPDNS